MTAGSFDRLPMDQPQGLCDIIGLAFRIWRKNLALIFRALIVPTILLSVSATALQLCLTYGTSGSNDFSRVMTYVGVGIAAFFLYLFSLFFLSVRQLAIVRLFTGFAPNWEKANSYCMKKLPWIAGLALISILIWSVIIGIFFCLIGLSTYFTSTGSVGAFFGIVGLVIAFFACIITVCLMAMFSFMGLAVLACEDTTFFGVIGQSIHWTWRYLGRVLCFGFMFYVIFTVVTIPVSLPVAVASIADVFIQQSAKAIAAGTASEHKLSLGVMIFVQVWEAICGLLLRPVTVLCFGLFYLDLRQRSDGLDLFRRLKDLKAQYIGDSPS